MKSDFLTSRRIFLQSAVTATLLPQALRAAPAGRKRLEFTIVSDTHLGYRDQTSSAEQWKKTAAEVAKAPGEFVLHLGDVVDGGREPQYAIYREIRDTIGKKVHEIPGNHDPQALFEKHLRRPIDTVVDLDWLRFVLVGNARVDSHDGFLSPAQVEWIGDQCASAAREGLKAVLAMHVPAHSNKHPDRGWHIKPNEGQTALYEVLTRRKETVVALFHGHFHNGIRGWDDHPPAHEIVFPSALYNLDRRLESQKAPGYNVAEFRPGFTQVTIEGDAMTLEYRVVGQDEGAKKSLRLPPGPA